MKMILVILSGISVVIVSLTTMVFGWGIEPENWGWIAFGYVWLIVAPMITESIK